MQRTQRNIAGSITILLPILALALSIVALYFVSVDRSDSRLDYTGSSQVTNEEAQVIMERVNDLLLTTDLVLGFLEGASVLAGVVLLGAGIIGFSSMQDLRRDTESIKSEVLERLARAEQELTERVESAQKELITRAEQLAALEAELEQAIQKNQARIDEQILAASKEARRSFEALSHHVMAQRLARENNILAALHACQDAHALDPDSVPNNYLLGTLLIKRHAIDEAVEYLTKAYEASTEGGDEPSTPSQAALGLALRKKGDTVTDAFERNRLYNQAEQFLLDATQHDPHLLNEDKESYFGVLGSLYRRQGRTQDAIAAYHRAAEVTPRRSYPFINLGMLYYALHDTINAEKYRKAAEQRARRRLEDTPEDFWALHDIALAVYMKGSIEEASKLFQEAIDLSPSISVLDSVLARLIYLRDIDAETPDIDRLIKLFEDAKGRFPVGPGGD